MAGETAQDWLSEGDDVDPATLVVKARGRRTRPVARPEVDTPVEPPPLPPGSLDRWLADAGMLAEDEPDPVSAVDLQAGASAALRSALPALRRVLAQPDASASDVAAAVRALTALSAPQATARDSKRRALSEIDDEIERELRAAGWQVTRPGGGG